MRRLRIAAGLTLACTAAPAQARQQPRPEDVRPQGTLTAAQLNDSALEARTKAVAAELRCPVCQGLSIQDSPSELSQQMRTVVKEQLAGGKSPEQVKDYFVSKYGEWILLEPRPRGFNFVVYLLPAALVLGGGAFIVMVVRRWTDTTVPDSSSPH